MQVRRLLVGERYARHGREDHVDRQEIGCRNVDRVEEIARVGHQVSAASLAALEGRDNGILTQQHQRIGAELMAAAVDGDAGLAVAYYSDRDAVYDAGCVVQTLESDQRRHDKIVGFEARVCKNLLKF